MFVLSLFCGSVLAAGARDGEKLDSREEKIPVVLTPAKSMLFRRVVSVHGCVESDKVVFVSPKVKGVLVKISVDEGDAVKKGETELFRTDSENLERSVRIKEQELRVAEQSLKEKKLRLEKLKLALSKHEKDYNRYKRLSAKDAVSENVLELAELQFRQDQVAVEHLRGLITLEEERRTQAQLAVEIARKKLRDATVYAPVSGRVTDKLKEPGEMGDPKAPVFRIVDMDNLELSAFVPAGYYGTVLSGKTKVEATVNGVDLGELAVTYKAPAIRAEGSNFEVECRIPEPPESCVPGSAAELDIILEEKEGIGVPEQAIQTRAGKSVLFLVEEERARSVEVETGLSTDGMIRVISKKVDAGTDVVTMGQFRLEDESPVRITGGE